MTREEVAEVHFQHHQVGYHPPDFLAVEIDREDRHHQVGDPAVGAVVLVGYLLAPAVQVVGLVAVVVLTAGAEEGNYQDSVLDDPEGMATGCARYRPVVVADRAAIQSADCRVAVAEPNLADGRTEIATVAVAAGQVAALDPVEAAAVAGLDRSCSGSDAADVEVDVTEAAN